MPSPKKKRTPRTPAKRRRQPSAKPATPQPKSTPTPVPAPAPKPASAQPARSDHTRTPDAEEAAPEPYSDAETVRVYLDELGTCGQYMAAARKARRHYSWFQRRRKADPAFADAEREALSSAPDAVRSEIARRAIEGVRSTVVTRWGVLEKIEYSDMLLLRYAEYLETGSWRQRQQVETGGPGAFKTRAEAEEALRSRRAELAKAETEMAEEAAREGAPKTEG